MINYTRDCYGQVRAAKADFIIWKDAWELINQAEKKKKIATSYDNLSWDRKGRSSGGAVHHEIYDIHPDPLRVLLCVRQTEGSKYGVKTTSKNYYIIKKHGKGVIVTDANKHIAAKSAKQAGCELGCAINILEGNGKLKSTQKPRLILPEYGYKKLAVLNDGRMYSVYDGSEYYMGKTRTEQAMKDHNGGLYCYLTLEEAKAAKFPDSSKFFHADKIIVKCKVGGNYVQYDAGKIAVSELTPVNAEVID